MTESLDPTTLLAPWRAVVPEEQRGLAGQLRREVARTHPLHKKRVVVLARRVDNDDVLFYVEDAPQPYAVVHLTWRRTREKDPRWPWTEFFNTLHRWHDDRMQLDHADYMAGENSE